MSKIKEEELLEQLLREFYVKGALITTFYMQKGLSENSNNIEEQFQLFLENKKKFISKFLSQLKSV